VVGQRQTPAVLPPGHSDCINSLEVVQSRVKWHFCADWEELLIQLLQGY